MNKCIFALTLLAVFFFTSCDNRTANTSIYIIPEPVDIVQNEGVFSLDRGSTYQIEGVDSQDVIIATICEGMDKNFGLRCAEGSGAITFQLNEQEDKTLGSEGYTLDVTSKHIVITANTTSGLFYGYQTLLQLSPEDISTKAYTTIDIPCVFITDYPRFEWRGTHLDVCRHYFDIPFIKKYIDILAMHKINKFHWHFTDDHGWRMEVDKYPALTEIGAWSVDRTKEPWGEALPPQKGEKATYGGYYTKEQMKEIVEYAKARNIDVIPEIEMPGHSSAILAAYPELSCENDEGEEYFVQIGPYWPPVAILCAGQDKVIDFMKDIIDEVIEIFPYEYIHVGGDEAIKTNWERCPLCQKRIKEEGLKDEAELQSWFMHEIEKHIISRGKKMIGWDEILEGGLSPTSTVMSWRGEDGGIAAAQSGNDVIMTPNTYCYLDYYQADPITEPLSIGGYIPLEKAYQFDPVPSLLNEEEAKFIKGGQCNMWTEFINTPDHVEYMLLPRLSAISEAVWSPKEVKSWSNFQDKIESILIRYEALGYNYCKGEYKPTISSTSTEDGKLLITMTAEKKQWPIHYTTDGSTPITSSPVYKEPFVIDKSTMIKAAVAVDGKVRPNVAAADLIISKLTGKNITISPTPSYKYAAKMEKTINDGEFGGLSFTNGKWIGFQDKEITVEIDNNGETFNKLFINTLISQPNWIMLPEVVEIYTSEYNNNYTKVGVIEIPAAEQIEGEHSRKIEYTFENGISPKYIKVIIKNLEGLPQWHASAGESPWIFIDEIWTE